MGQNDILGNGSNEAKYALLNAFSPENKLGKGTDGYVYAFPQKELANYVMRLENIPDRESLWRLLDQTTSLTPVKQLIRGINVGQDLLVLRNGTQTVSIHARKPGESLADLCHGAHKNSADPVCYTSLLQEIAALHTKKHNPFTTLLNDAYVLSLAGYKVDTNLENIFLDKTNGTLGWIDQVHHTPPGAPQSFDTFVDNLKLSLSSPYITDNNPYATTLNITGASREALKRIAFAINEAKKEVERKYSLYPELKKPEALFATPSNTSPVSVEDNVDTFVGRLEALRRDAKIPSQETQR